MQRVRRATCCLLAAAWLALATPTLAGVGCVGDCDTNGRVTIAEVIYSIGCILQVHCLDCCDIECLDANGNGSVSINEMIAALNNALGGCRS